MQFVEKYIGNDWAQYGYTDKGICSNLRCLTAGAQNTRAYHLICFRKADNSYICNDKAAEREKFRIMCIDSKDLRTKYIGQKKCDDREGEAPTNSRPQIAPPFIGLVLIATVPCKHGARLSHPVAEIIVEIAEIHRNGVYCIGNRPKFRHHACIYDHADAFKSLLAENTTEYAEKFAEIGACQTIVALIEYPPCREYANGQKERPYCPADCPERGTE